MTNRRNVSNRFFWRFENRAKAQQLAFPQDSGLLLRGQVFAWTADGLYVAGVVTGGIGAAMWLLHAPPSEPGA